jgi:hypothetical protein
MIEPRHRRQHDRAKTRELEHVLQVHDRERRLARHDDQRTAFLERNVRSPFDEVAREPVRDARQRSHAAGHDDRSFDGGAARRRSRLDGIDRMHEQTAAQVRREQRCEIRLLEVDTQAGFVHEHAQRSSSRTEVDLVTALQQHLDEPQTVGNAAATGEADGEALLRGDFRPSCSRVSVHR